MIYASQTQSSININELLPNLSWKAVLHSGVFIGSQHSPTRHCSIQYSVIYRVRQLLVTTNVPSSPILVTLMMPAPGSSETSVLTRVTRRNIPEN
jgi:hypothetical protein